jgi:zinc D-Ala-D-Ala carboxypeptidase
MTPLSKSFSLQEATISETAVRNGISNEPDDRQLANMIAAADSLQLLRDYLKEPILITSWLRTAELNELIPGSSKTSSHMDGFAIDCHVSSMSPMELCKVTKRFLDDKGIPFDQIIYEYGAWMHVSFDPKNRRQTLTIFKATGKSYLPGIITREQYLAA